MQEDYLRMKKEEVANAQKMRECASILHMLDEAALMSSDHCICPAARHCLPLHALQG